MKKKFTLIALLLCCFLFAQPKKGNVSLTPGSASHRLYVSFHPGIDVSNANAAGISALVPGFAELAANYTITVQRAVPIPEAKLQELEALALKYTGSAASVAKLRNIIQIEIENPVNEKLLELALALEELEEVEYCDLISAEPVKPPYDILPVTPVFESLQGYIGDLGVKMDYAWDMGLTGQGINIRDIEYGFNENHEELEHRNAFLGQGTAISPEVSVAYSEHGTAVMGIMFADKEENYGISGMAHGANEMLLFPEWQPAGHNRVLAISQCIAVSGEGDIVLYEMQAGGAQGNFGPAEYVSLVWDLTKAASDAGIIIVAAAGNGSENLDAAVYTSYRDRGDSGAIIVGAGTNDGLNQRIGFSTYGSRVNVQAWGTGVYTSGYGDAASIGGDFNQGYTLFGGTSSATPIVASCVVVLQSYYHSLTGEYLTGPQMRELLIATGTPQATGDFGQIGPAPNMENAITAIDEMLDVKRFGKSVGFTVYPNPVKDRLSISGDALSGLAKAEIYNFMGQLVYSGPLSGNSEIDFSSFAKGVYVIKITDRGASVSRRIIKD